MGSARIKKVVLIGFLILMAVIFGLSERNRQTRLHQIVGTWTHTGKDYIDRPLVLHIFENHTYFQEVLGWRDSERGTWRFSGFPDRSKVILDSYIHGTDTHMDGFFALDPVRKALSSDRSTWDFQKASDQTKLPMSNEEERIIGYWRGQSSKSESLQRLYLFSDHQFMIEFESVGKWHIANRQLFLEWISDEDHQPQKSKLSIDLPHRRITFIPEGYSLIRD